MKFVDHDHLRMGAGVTGDRKAEDAAMSLADTREKKLCFVYCGERCNCEVGMDWKLSEGAKALIREIDENAALASSRVTIAG